MRQGRGKESGSDDRRRGLCMLMSESVSSSLNDLIASRLVSVS